MQNLECRVICVVAALVMVAISGVRVAAQDEKTSVDILAATKLPPQLIGHILPTISERTGSDVPFGFQILDKDGKPLAAEKLKLTWDGGEKTLTTDDQGNLTIEISKEQLSELNLTIPAGASCKLVHSMIKFGTGQAPQGGILPQGGMPPNFRPAKGMKIPGLGGLGPRYDQKLVGKKAPEIKLEKLIGAPADAEGTLESLKGKVVVLDFWATWCKPCVASFPKLSKLQKELSDDFVIIAIADQDEETVAPVLEKNPLETWVGLDVDGSVVGDYGVAARPTAVVIDREGKVAAVTHSQALTVSALKEVAAGRPFPQHSMLPKPVDITPKDNSENYQIRLADLLPKGKASAFPFKSKDMSAGGSGDQAEPGKMAITFEIRDSEGELAKDLEVEVLDGEATQTMKTSDAGRLVVTFAKDRVSDLAVQIPANHRVFRVVQIPARR